MNTNLGLWILVISFHQLVHRRWWPVADWQLVSWCASDSTFKFFFGSIFVVSSFVSFFSSTNQSIVWSLYSLIDSVYACSEVRVSFESNKNIQLEVVFIRPVLKWPSAPVKQVSFKERAKLFQNKTAGFVVNIKSAFEIFKLWPSIHLFEVLPLKVLRSRPSSATRSLEQASQSASCLMKFFFQTQKTVYLNFLVFVSLAAASPPLSFWRQSLHLKFRS